MRVRQLAEGSFGSMVILPRQSKLGEGRVLLAYEGDELADGPVGARHRSVIRPGPGGVSSMTVRFGLQFADVLTGSNGDRTGEELRRIHERCSGSGRQAVRQSSVILYPWIKLC